jgi:dTDP-4-dehydrorhamnose reductase
MKILLFGATGILGSDIRSVFQSAGHEVISISHGDADFRDHAALADIFISNPGISWVINCAAYTKVDQAESEESLAFAVNGDAVDYIASLCESEHIPMVHFSTDYVFNGEQDSPYLEEDDCDPINKYGASKRAGEHAFLESGVSGYILRIQWLFGRHGVHFLDRISQLAKSNPRLSIVNDQWGCPTWTWHVAEAVLALISHRPEDGVYHFSNQGVCTWFEYATFFLEAQGISCELIPISTEDYPTPAKRPLNSRLDISKFCELGIYTPPSWEEAVLDYLKRRS